MGTEQRAGRRPPVLLGAAVALLGCGDLTDADLGECADPTVQWLPLLPRAEWSYDQYDLAHNRTSIKYMNVQYDSSAIHGLLGDERAVRTWRANRGRDGKVYEAGWRWVTATPEGFWWRADIWLEGGTLSAPCDSLGPNEDPRQCPELVDLEPYRDRTYFPGKPRLDLSDAHLCERSVWTSTYTERTLTIGHGGTDECDRQTWRDQIEECNPVDTRATDQWSVQYVHRRIVVPAGAFEDCLCVRRKINGGADGDWTYCFAPNVGKVYELERNVQVECLTEYYIDADTAGSSSGEECDLHQVEP